MVIVLIALSMRGWSEGATSASPDGKIIIEQSSKAVEDGIEHDLTIHENGHVVYHSVIPATRDVRALRFSWSPASNAVLIGEYEKAGEDLLLVQFRDGKAKETFFDGDRLVIAKLLASLPLDPGSRNSAPVAAVYWKGIQWRDRDHCTFTYFHHGIGHNGSAQVEIVIGKEPRLNILSIDNTLPAEPRF